MNDPYTYIEEDTLRAWGGQMTRLNNEAKEILESVLAEVKALGEYWKGNAADGFTEVINRLTDSGKQYHTEMKDIEKMLNEVVNTALNQ